MLATLSQLRGRRYGYELRQALVEKGLAIEDGPHRLLQTLTNHTATRFAWFSLLSLVLFALAIKAALLGY